MAKYSSDTFFEELLRISSNIIWKNPEKALKGEVDVSPIDVEQYNLAVRGTLTFDLIHKFEKDVLLKFGFDEEMAESCIYDPYRIPEAMRDSITKAHIEYIKENYEEKNNYYRMLNGLPDIEDTDFVYNTKYPDISSPNIPIHLLDINAINQLDREGYLDELIQKYPEKEYLNHLSDKKISIYNSRNIADFGILWIINSEYDNLLRDFKDTYSECRNMVTTVYYQKEMYQTNSEYTGFIGLIILFSTIMQMYRKCLDTDITRDFYDNESLQYVYESYGVPYYDSLPMEYHKKIIKNINLLIGCKGSPEVFFKIFDLFGFGSTSLYAYFILKTHRFVNGKPIFPKDENGNLNLREMYDIKFSKVKLWDSPSLEVRDPKNYSSYDDMTRDDPYWINDENLLNKIYEEEYNYRETKYFGIQTTFNLMKIIYESTYYFKMILDNRELLPYTKIYNSTLQQEVTLFDMIIYLCAIIIRKYGYMGNIPDEPHAIGRFMGFNFQEDLTILKENITSNDYLKNDAELLDYLTLMPVSSLDAIRIVYGKMVNLRRYLANKMFETDDPDIYHAYYELYQTLMYSEYTKETFTKSDGTQANTFEELLSDSNPTLYARYLNEDIDFDMEITSTLFFLENSCDLLNQLQFLSLPNSNFLLENIFKLLEYFKSAKTDLTGYNIIYSLVSDVDNYFKLMNIISYIYDDYSEQPLESIIDYLNDIIAYIKERQYLYAKYFLKDDISLDETVYLPPVALYLRDYIANMIEIVFGITEDLFYKEEVKIEEIFILPNDQFPFSDDLSLIYDEVMEKLIEYVEELFPIYTNIKEMAERFLPVESQNLFISRLMCLELIKIKHTTYYLKDQDPKIKDVTNQEFKYMLDFIFHSCMDNSKLTENILTGDLIAKYFEEHGLSDSYRLKMSEPKIHDSETFKSEFMIINIINIYIEKLHLKDEIFTEDLISRYLEKINNHASFTLIDDYKDKLIYEIIIDMEENPIYYLDHLIDKLSIYFIEVINNFVDEIVSINDKHNPVSEEFSLVTQVISKLKTSYITSSTKLEDDIILVFEYKEEE